MSKLRKSILITSLSSFMGKLLALVSTVIIARLLTPSELGVYAIAAAAVLVIGELKSFGVGGYLIRKKSIEVNDIQNALGVSIVISWLLGFLLIAFSWLLEDFYQQDNIAILIQILSISFFISPYISIGKAIFSRDFLFDKIATINIAVQSIQLIITVVLLLSGLSYYSIAIALSVSSIVEVFLVYKLSTFNFVCIPRFNNFKLLFNFGVFVTFSNMFRRVSLSTPDLIIGRVGTMTDVAFFSRSAGLLDFISSAVHKGIRPVATPFLAEQKRHGKDMENAYNKAIQMVGALLIPVLSVVGLASYPIILFMFGEQWLQSSPIASILCLWSIFRIIHMFFPSLMLTIGYEKILFMKEAGLLLLTVFAIYFGYTYGLIGVAWSLVAVAVIDFLVCTILTKLLLKFEYRKFIKVLLPNVFITFSCSLATLCLDYYFPFKETNIAQTIFSLVFLSSVTWLFSIKIISHPIYIEIMNIYRKRLT